MNMAMKGTTKHSIAAGPTSFSISLHFIIYFYPSQIIFFCITPNLAKDLVALGGLDPPEQ